MLFMKGIFQEDFVVGGLRRGFLTPCAFMTRIMTE